ncbi:MAG: transposase [candidate division NC10 bacterium]|nr:transposase [candidate division NC10 bacterium]
MAAQSTAEGFQALLELLRPVFTAPSFLLFRELACAWVLCPGRHTITRMIGLLQRPGRCSHDAYHRFVREGAWSLAELWRLLAQVLVRALAPRGTLSLDLDDTLFHKSGRKVEGVGTFRDAVRSAGKQVVYALGLNLVVVTLRVVPPWGGMPLGLPIGVRLYRKGGPSHLDLAEAILGDLARWFPDRSFLLCADGAYASLAGRSLPRTDVVSRLRRDAALYEPPPPRRPGQRGRPRKKGRRLPCPQEMARRTRKGWRRAAVEFRGRNEERLVLARLVLWYQVCQDRPVLLVVVRDPQGREPDDFFFTTELGADAAGVAGHYNGRWSVEETFRNTKQFLGGEDPQTWKGEGPERAASLSFMLYSSIWLGYILTQGARRTWVPLPWYESKATPSFADALASLRRALWRRRLFCGSHPRPLGPKMAAAVIEVLARAA